MNIVIFTEKGGTRRNMRPNDFFRLIIIMLTLGASIIYAFANNWGNSLLYFGIALTFFSALI